MLSLPAEFFFIRHGQLIDPYLNHLTMDYEVLADLASGVLDPSINTNALQLFLQQTSGVDFSKVTTIYYNNSGHSSQRSLESARCILNILQERYNKIIPLKGMPEIDEVKFDVRGLVSKPEFLKQGMPSIRAALYQAALCGGATEAITEIVKRIEAIHRVIIRHASNGESVLFVTHDFFMRFLEVYITKATRFNSAATKDLEKTSLNSYFCGFKSNSDFDTIQRWGNANVISQSS